VLGLRLSRSLKLKLQSRQQRKMVRVNVETAINSALSNQFAILTGGPISAKLGMYILWVWWNNF